MFLKQSTASQTRTIGPFVDDTDFKTLKNALTITNTDVLLKKNGGASAAKNSGGATADGSGGLYHLTFDATDTATVGELAGSVKVAGALVVPFKFFVLEEAVYDAMFAASAVGYVANAPVNVAQFGGSNLTATGGRPEVNTTHWNGTAVASAVILAAANIASDAIAAAKIAAGALNGKGDWNIGKTGYALSSAGVQAIWDALTSALTTVGSIGKLLVDNVNATISSRSSHSAADVWSAGTRTLTAGTNIALAKGTGVTGFNDLDAAGVRSAVGLASANLDTQLGAIDDFIDTEVAAALAHLVNLVAAGFTRTGTAQAGSGTTIRLDAGASSVTNFYINQLVVISSGTGAGQARYITAYNGTTKDATVGTWATNPSTDSVFFLLPGDSIPGATAPTAAAVADAVWDELLSGHAVSGSAGEALSAAGTAGDPWTTALPGAYGAGTAGKIIGDNVNATISSRSTHAAADIWSVGTRALTDKSGFALSSAGVQAIWDALTSALTTVGSVGKLLVDNVNATISSRAATGDAMTLTSGERTSIGTAVWATTTRTLTSFGTLVADIWASVADSAGVTTLLSRLSAIRAGNLDNLDATVSSRLSSAGYTAPPSAATNASAVRTELTTELGRVDAAISTRATPAQVNAEALAVLATDTHAEPASVPAATASLKDKIGWLFTLSRNRQERTATVASLKNDAEAADIATATLSDDGTTFVRDEWV